MREGPRLRHGTVTAKARTAEVAPPAAAVDSVAIIRNRVGIHRHCAGLGKGPATKYPSSGIQGYAAEREDITSKGGARTKSSGAAYLKVHAIICAAIDHLDI